MTTQHLSAGLIKCRRGFDTPLFGFIEVCDVFFFFLCGCVCVCVYCLSEDNNDDDDDDDDKYINYKFASFSVCVY